MGAVKKAPSICYTGQCNRNVPCYSFATGTCSAMVAEAYAPAYAASYSAPTVATYSAPTEESGYRRLQQFANPNVRLHCPPGTVDSYNWAMHKQTVLWVGFGFLLFASSGAPSKRKWLQGQEMQESLPQNQPQES